MSDQTSSLRVQPGCQVELVLLSRSGEREKLIFDLVPDPQADYQAGFLSISTPLAKTILGENAGITIPYFTEELMAVEIIAIRESTREAAEGAASQRQAAIQDAKDQIEYTNAVLFAASMNTKWGSYDADGLDYENWKTNQSDKLTEGDNDPSE